MPPNLRNGRPGGDNTTPALKVAQISTPQAGMGSCARCRARWGGFKTAQCACCGEGPTVAMLVDKTGFDTAVIEETLGSLLERELVEPCVEDEFGQPADDRWRFCYYKYVKDAPDQAARHSLRLSYYSKAVGVQDI